uniref:Uncharacterized protein n=1 Tax=Phlegmariurus squarrosus TaxID=73615 RepID=H9M834_PHLSQ|nr:hypothetical protein HusqMp26 [Phlegmariurus squarrosus]AEV55741.1 hypothetical protein HusqMp26 [Phlegmariurus squarrosus]
MTLPGGRRQKPKVFGLLRKRPRSAQDELIRPWFWQRCRRRHRRAFFLGALRDLGCLDRTRIHFGLCLWNIKLLKTGANQPVNQSGIDKLSNIWRRPLLLSLWAVLLII